MLRSCNVPLCPTPKIYRSLHYLPTNELVRKKWIKVLNLENKKISKRFQVCSSHFDTSDFLPSKSDRVYLKKFVVPSRNLPSIDSNTVVTNKPKYDQKSLTIDSITDEEKTSIDDQFSCQYIVEEVVVVQPVEHSNESVSRDYFKDKDSSLDGYDHFILNLENNDKPEEELDEEDNTQLLLINNETLKEYPDECIQILQISSPKSTMAADRTSDTNCSNMVSNLPLLFAGGYPTSLEKITESQLEKFIPFMVQCSLGNIQIHNNTEYSEPEWWPENVPFSIPLERPVDESDWHEKLKSIVIVCYRFHSSIFLLRFCQQLATYQPESLRFINNNNLTTSLFERSSNKLLVTFRNENMLYDQAAVNKTSKKTLLSSSWKTNSQSKVSEEMVDTIETVFEIYLCDNCEAELYSKDAYDEHEKTCQEDDDVIFCGEEYVTDHPIDKQLKEQSSFMQNFALFNPNCPVTNLMKTPVKKNTNELLFSPKAKCRRQPRRSQIVLSSNIPFSSPAGQQLIQLSKSTLAEGYIQEKLERTERYCCAPPLGEDTFSNWLKSVRYNRTLVTFRRPQVFIHRWYKFPRRQNYGSWHRQAFLKLNINELKSCRPAVVKLKRLTKSEIEAFHLENRNKKIIKKGLNKRAKDEESDRSNIVDVIDLCSSDEDSNHFACTELSHNQDIGNVSQTATTPASNKSPSFIAPIQTTVPMYNETSSQATIFNSDENYRNQENHKSFLNGAQGSIVTNIASVSELKEISANQAHISIDLTL